MREFKQENYDLNATINRNLARVKDQLDRLSKTAADSHAEQQIIKEQIREIQGSLEEMRYTHNQFTSKVVSYMRGTDAEGLSSDMTSDSSIDFEGSELAEKIYQGAYYDFVRGDYELAIVGFQEFLKEFSNHNLADNARYWIAECWYTKGDYEKAIDSFDKVIKNYAQGDKVPSAYLKKGYSLLQLKRESEGIDILKQLQEKFPDSSEARLAQERLKDLR